ncbi:MAG: hypothetical protein MI862_06205, partial [Desulfobacterales bacterium]|nr:hypothetical protein [Desulfobacterales bacterium]
MAGLFIIGSFLLDHTLIQSIINHNLYLEIKTYYLAQAGIEYATYRLQVEPDWRINSWEHNITETDKFDLTITEDETFIVVRSTGIHWEFQLTLEAHFSKNPPISRIK